MAYVMGVVLVLGAVGAVAWMVISLDPRAERADERDLADQPTTTDTSVRPPGPGER